MMRLSTDLRLNLPSRPCVPKPMSVGVATVQAHAQCSSIIVMMSRVRVPELVVSDSVWRVGTLYRMSVLREYSNSKFLT